MEELKKETRTMIIYEAPHHLKKTIEELNIELGSDRRITIERELTKRYEEKLQMTLGQAVEYYKTVEPRGEYVLVIAGRSKEEVEEESRARWEGLSLEEHMAIYEGEGLSRKDAMKAVAKDLGISKRDVYQQLLGEE